MRLSCYIFGSRWWFQIHNSKLRVEKKAGKNLHRESHSRFTQGISFDIFSKEYHIGNTELDSLIGISMKQEGSTLLHS